jgi:hypothetical protein
VSFSLSSTSIRVTTGLIRRNKWPAGIGSITDYNLASADEDDLSVAVTRQSRSSATGSIDNSL